MRLSIEADPNHPLGGHALLRLDGVDPNGDLAFVIRRTAEGDYLGPSGWQGPAHRFPAGDVRAIDGGAVIAVGPDIVDAIETYTQIVLEVPGQGFRAIEAWPDDVVPSPGGAAGGGIGRMAPPPPPEPTTLRTVTPEPVKPDPIEAEPATTEPDETPPLPRPPKKALPYMLATLVGLTFLGAGAWWYLSQPEPGPDPVVLPAPSDPVPAPGCSPADLAAARELPVEQGFAAVERCGAEGDPELRFAVIRAAADAGMGEGLALLGKWWDPIHAQSVGSTFTHSDPAQAARYYSEAAAAGYAPAAELLREACAALDPAASPHDELAQEIYCSE